MRGHPIELNIWQGPKSRHHSVEQRAKDLSSILFEGSP